MEKEQSRVMTGRGRRGEFFKRTFDHQDKAHPAPMPTCRASPLPGPAEALPADHLEENGRLEERKGSVTEGQEGERAPVQDRHTQGAASMGLRKWNQDLGFPDKKPSTTGEDAKQASPLPSRSLIHRAQTGACES